MHHHTKQTRRAFLGTTALAGAALPLAGRPSAAATGTGEDFRFEIRRSEAEWKEILSDYEFQILRKGGTEWPRSNPLWDDYREGTFRCRGCELHLYSSDWRAEIDKGWVFFDHSQPNAVLTDIDTAANYSMQPGQERTMIEVHCRRCGSHLGHLLTVEGRLVHCINGASLAFEPATA